MKIKKVMEAKMYGRHLAVYQRDGWAFKFGVYEIAGTNVFIDEFESFQEALECVTKELYA